MAGPIRPDPAEVIVAKLRRLPCLFCGRPVHPSALGGLWHALNRWHNPFSVGATIKKADPKGFWIGVGVGVVVCVLTAIVVAWSLR